MKKNHVHSKKNFQRMKVIGHIHDYSGIRADLVVEGSFK